MRCLWISYDVNYDFVFRVTSDYGRSFIDWTVCHYVSTLLTLLKLYFIYEQLVTYISPTCETVGHYQYMDFITAFRSFCLNFVSRLFLVLFFAKIIWHLLCNFIIRNKRSSLNFVQINNQLTNINRVRFSKNYLPNYSQDLYWANINKQTSVSKYEVLVEDMSCLWNTFRIIILFKALVVLGYKNKCYFLYHTLPFTWC